MYNVLLCILCPAVLAQTFREKICCLNFFFKDFIYLFLEREEGREKEWERHINVWLLLTRPLLGTWPATQACALTGNRTGDPLVRRPVLNPLSHTSQARFNFLIQFFNIFIFRNKTDDLIPGIILHRYHYCFLELHF